MLQDPKSKEISVWRSGYAFALLLLFLLGCTLITIGAAIFSQGSLPNVMFVSSGISLAPSAIVAALFRFFLFKEVQYQLTQPVLDGVKERLGPEIQEQVNELIEQYRREIIVLRVLKEAGVVCPHQLRERALRDFASAIDTEEKDIMIIGSSLKGLLQVDEIANKLKFKIATGGVRVRFLLTHPVVADLRAGQEARQPTDIGMEIIGCLATLKEWKVPPHDVRLYKGTPTCFAIKTERKMLLNPYPYGKVAYDSPCLIIETSDEHPSYFYGAFKASHFSAWDTNFAEHIHDYDATIRDLELKINKYAQTVAQMLSQ